MADLPRRFLKDASGATAIEYALIASFVALAIIASVRSIGPKLSTILGRVTSNLS